MSRPAFAAVSALAGLLAWSACQGDSGAPRSVAPATTSGAPGPASREFELTPPTGFRRVAAPDGILGAWEGTAYENGFTPTLRIAKEPALSPDSTETCDAWRTRALGQLGKAYIGVKVIGGANSIEGPAAPGCLLIAEVGLPMPQHGGKPMPLVAYGAAYPRGATLYTLAALTGQGYDVQAGQAAPLHELGILRAVTSFRTITPAASAPTP